MIPEQSQLQIGNLHSFYKANLQFSAWLLRQDFISDSLYPNVWNKFVCRSMQTINTQSSTPFTSAKRSASKNSIAYSWTPRKTLKNIRVNSRSTLKGKKTFHPFLFSLVLDSVYIVQSIGDGGNQCSIYYKFKSESLLALWDMCAQGKVSGNQLHIVINLQIMTESIGEQDNCTMT